MFAGISDYATFCAAILLFLMVPGPGNFALIVATSKGGIRSGMATCFGLTLGDQCLLWMALAGVAAVLAAMPGLFFAVQWLGAAYLGWIGLRLLLPRRRRSGDPTEAREISVTPMRQLRQGILVSLLNPKAIVFYMAFFPMFMDPAHHQGWLTFAVMALTMAILGCMYSTIVVLVVHGLASRLRANPLIGRILECLAGVFLLGFGLRLAFSR